MRVLLVHNSYQQRGGEDTVFETEYEALVANGLHVECYRASNQVMQGSAGVIAAGNAVWNRAEARRLREAMEEFKPSIVHVHNTLSVISPAVFHVAKSVGAATVHTLHNYRLLCPGATFFRAGKVCEDCFGKKIPWPAVRHGCYRGSKKASAAVVAMLTTHELLGTFRDKVDLLLPLTEFAKQKFRETGYPESKLMVKPNFLSVDPGLGTGDGGYALFVGRLSPEKGLGPLLAAWNDLGESIPLRIVGTGPLDEEIRQQAGQLKSVTLMGPMDRDDTIAQMKRAAVLLVPSEWYEGLSMVAIEAFAVGLPVLASRLGALEEVVDEGVNGLHFSPGDAKSIADVVRKYFAEKERIPALRRGARATFEAKYSAAIGFQALERAYVRAIELAGSAAK